MLSIFHTRTSEPAVEMGLPPRGPVSELALLLLPAKEFSSGCASKSGGCPRGGEEAS